MTTTVFFSWQADTPTREGRNFIERALNQALKRLKSDANIEDAVRGGLELDKDTKGVGGQPAIVDTIFKKIDQAAVFVPDLTFVGKRLDGRPTPNPNVLIEYGWALKSLSNNRIVPVMNTAHGKPDREAMPFNMRHLRFPITYDLSNTADDEMRKGELEKLAKDFEHHLRIIFDSAEFRDSLPKPPPPVPFPAAQPKSGQARFRAQGQALGIREESFNFMAEPSNEVHLVDGPAIWLRLMPTKALDRSWTATEIRKVATENGLMLSTLMNAWRDGSYLRAEDGWGFYPVYDDKSHTTAVTFLFETGEVWSIDTYPLKPAKEHSEESKKKMGFEPPERPMEAALSRSAQFLGRLGINPPYKWIAGIEGVRGAGLYYPPPPGHYFVDSGPRGTLVSDVIIEEGILSAGASTRGALKPFFVKLFSKCGIERPDYLDKIAGTQ